MSFLFRSLMLLNIVFAFSACGSDSATNDDGAEVQIEDTVHDVVMAGTDTSMTVKNSPFLWHADFEETSNRYKISKPSEARPDTLSGERMVSLINNNWDSITVNYLKTSHDTVYLDVPNSEYLTQRIGSSGAENFIATTTYSLTELTGVKYVNFKFKAGDHATPGVYKRSDFKSME